MKNILLKGSQHSLTVFGYEDVSQGWTGSEYYQRECTYHGWVGNGVLLHLASKELTLFGWTSRETQSARLFESVVFDLGFFSSVQYQDLDILKHTALIDYFIRRVVDKLAECQPVEEEFPCIELPLLDMRYMQEHGIIPLDSGQLGLSLD